MPPGGARRPVGGLPAPTRLEYRKWANPPVMGVSAHLGRQNQPLVSMKYPMGSRLGLMRGLVMGRRCVAGPGWRRWGCPASTILAGLASISFAGAPLVLSPLLSDVGTKAGDIEFQDEGMVHSPVDGRGSGHGISEDMLPLGEDQSLPSATTGGWR